MDNVILRKTIALIWKLLIAYSIYIFLRGHNEPGGGFIGGLLLALGLILRGYISRTKEFENRLLVHYEKALGVLLLFFLTVIVVPTFFAEEVLRGLWTTIWIPIAGKLSSVLLFDLAVYGIVATSALYAHQALYSIFKENAK